MASVQPYIEAYIKAVQPSLSYVVYYYKNGVNKSLFPDIAAYIKHVLFLLSNKFY